MDAGIHAAIIDGIIAGTLGGLTVAGGIWLSTTIERRRSRRRAVEVAFQALVSPLGRTASGLVDQSTDRRLDSPWYQSFNQTHSLLVQIQSEARDFPGAEEVRQAADQLAMNVHAANDIVLRGGRLSPAVALVVGDTTDLRDAIYGTESRDAENRLQEFDRVRARLAGMPMPSGR